MENVAENGALVVHTPPKKIYLFLKENSETIAKIIRVNPAIYSQFFGIGIHVFLDQFLKLWPLRRLQALPYISIPSVLLAALGWKIGADSLRRPVGDTINSDPIKRVSVAMLEGVGGVFPFLLGEIIQAYCKNPKHLDKNGSCKVSEATFWELFFTTPASLILFYIAWYSIDPQKKDIWAKKGGIVMKAFVTLTDVFTRTLFYTRVLQSLVTNIYVLPRPIMYEYGVVPAGSLILAAQLLKPKYWEKLETGIIYAMILSLSFYIVNFLETELHESSEPYLWSPMLKMLSFPLLFLSGLVLIVMHCKAYFEENAQRMRVALDRTQNAITLPYQHATCAVLENHINADRSLVPVVSVPETDANSSLKQQQARQALKCRITIKVYEEMGFEVEHKDMSYATSSIKNMSLQALLRDSRYQEVTKEVLEELKPLRVGHRLPSDDLDINSSQQPRDVEMPSSPPKTDEHSLLLGDTTASASSALLFSYGGTDSASRSSQDQSHNETKLGRTSSIKIMV